MDSSFIGTPSRLKDKETLWDKKTQGFWRHLWVVTSGIIAVSKLSALWILQYYINPLRSAKDASYEAASRLSLTV